MQVTFICTNTTTPTEGGGYNGSDDDNAWAHIDPKRHICTHNKRSSPNWLASHRHFNWRHTLSIKAEQIKWKLVDFVDVSDVVNK